MSDHGPRLQFGGDVCGLRPVRRAIACLFAAALAVGCAREAPERCDITVTREIAFTSADTADVVIAQAIGASCDKATLLYIVTDPEKRSIWAWASPSPRAFGEGFVQDEPEQMQSFLEQWAQPEVLRTSDAPPWNELQSSQTTLDQLTYDDIRARDLPMLCHYSGTARQACVFWEPAAGGAGLFYDRDVEETVE